ncbi:MAG TPA: dTDP-4-dehydrorhamnose reductase, partial [Burkholderiaceae bacterium]|nr:dTDP-4-dehydrorhamnose reductase [Burkholderiaceae bacterium]
IINAAAYTHVDRAETEHQRAIAINADGPANLAAAARSVDARLIHVSTDFVFDGGSSRPYRPEDTAAPTSAYGLSKLEGERRVTAIGEQRVLIVRTAWLYAARGNNFVNTMLKLMRERQELRVVADQIGTPTWATTLARALWAAARRPALHGIYHWTDAGVASWYDFAVAIQEEALARKLLARAIPICPIRTEDYPTPAKRPAYSVLDKTRSVADFDMPLVHWRAALRQMFAELAHG